MPFIVPFIPAIIAGGAAVGAAALSANASKSAAKSGASAANDRQMDLQNQLNSRQAGEESDANKLAVRNQARQRQLSLAQAATGRNDTILTSPLGDVGATTGSQKTILGT